MAGFECWRYTAPMEPQRQRTFLHRRRWQADVGRHRDGNGRSDVQGRNTSRVVCNANRASPSGHTTAAVRRFSGWPALLNQCTSRKLSRLTHHRRSELESRREEMTLKFPPLELAS